MQEVLSTSLLPTPPGLWVSNVNVQPDEGVRPPPGLTLQEPRSQPLVEDPVSRECVSLVSVVLNVTKQILVWLDWQRSISADFALKEPFHREQMRRWEEDEEWTRKDGDGWLGVMGSSR